MPARDSATFVNVRLSRLGGRRGSTAGILAATETVVSAQALLERVQLGVQLLRQTRELSEVLVEMG